MAQAVFTEEREIGNGGRTEYRLYLIAFYPFCLIAACIARILPKGRGQTSRKMVFRDAADMAHSIIPWVFSGR
ncbi:MAG: hypothetical protein AAGD92_12490 [Pseudomonadota bacterium]